MKRDDLRIGILVGHGSYGYVYKAEMTRGVVAVKQVSQHANMPGVPQNACREIGLLRELKHPHIVNLIDVRMNLEKQVVSMLLDWAEYDLQGIIKQHRKMESNAVDMAQRGHALMPVSMIRAIMFQLLDATEYLHSQWCMHRDIKPANVLLCPEGRVKLADFGLARIFRAPPRPLVDDHTVATPWYRAPELILGTRHYTPAVDVWALGALFGELVLLSPMFPGGREEDGVAKDQLLKIVHSLGFPEWSALPDTPLWPTARLWPELVAAPPPSAALPGLRDLLVRRMFAASAKQASHAECNNAAAVLFSMLCFDPTKRVTCKAAKQMSFFAGFTGLTNINVLSEYSRNWRQVYAMRQKCNCPDCLAETKK